MRAYDWPGNVRELRNAVHYAAVMAPTGVIQVQDLPQSLHSGPAHNETLNETEVEATRRRVRRAYEENDTVEEIAHILDVHPKYLPRLLDKIGLAYLKRRRGLATASRSWM